MQIVRSTKNVEIECERVLRSLPMWFGQEDSILQYVNDTSRLPTWISVDSDGIHGFLTLRQHSLKSFEINCIAIHEKYRGGGIGRRLIEESSLWASAQGGEFLQVKTIAAAVDDPAYAQTREFYAHTGFVELETFSTLWSAVHPCLQLIKNI